MHQPWTPWGGHISLMFGFSCTSTLVLGGASGVRLQSKAPLSWVCAERRGLICEPRMRFRQISACGSNLSHRFSGKLRSVLLSAAMKWLLNVRIARSAALRRWIWRGASW
jgi:hypothetical protein